ncbi:MAG: DUF433 domain-containing protein [Marmoricola sp.]
MIDPRFGWGAPVLARSKVPVDALVSLWKNGESISAVSEEYDLPADVVEKVHPADHRVSAQRNDAMVRQFAGVELFPSGGRASNVAWPVEMPSA